MVSNLTLKQLIQPLVTKYKQKLPVDDAIQPLVTKYKQKLPIGDAIQPLVTKYKQTLEPHFNMGLGQRINPFQAEYNLKVTPWIAIPSYILLLGSASILLIIIHKHFRSLLEIYISVIFYLCCQLLLLLTLSGTWATELLSEESLEMCRVKIALQTFAILLPGYSIMMITAARSIFLTYPLSYLHYLQLRIQLLGFIAACLVCGLISGLPLLGVCHTKLNYTESRQKYCTYGDKKKSPCTVFYSILLVLGFLLPILTVFSLYGYIYTVVKKARKSHKQLSSTSMTSEERSSGRLKETKARRSVPWSIIAILGVSITTTLPWAATLIYTAELAEVLTKGGDISILFDLFYSLLQLFVGSSPLVYLLTTNSLRDIFVRNLRRVFHCTSVREVPARSNKTSSNISATSVKTV